MKPAQVIKHFGTQQATAEALGLTQGAVSQWVKSGRIPYLRQLAIQFATDGALKADAPKPKQVTA